MTPNPQTGFLMSQIPFANGEKIPFAKNPWLQTGCVTKNKHLLSLTYVIKRMNGLSIGFDQMSFDWIDGLIDGAAGRLAAGATMQQCLAVHEIPLCQIYLPSPLSSHKASCFIYIFFTSFSCSFTC